MSLSLSLSLTLSSRPFFSQPDCYPPLSNSFVHCLFLSQAIVVVCGFGGLGLNLVGSFLDLQCLGGLGLL